MQTLCPYVLSHTILDRSCFLASAPTICFLEGMDNFKGMRCCHSRMGAMTAWHQCCENCDRKFQWSFDLEGIGEMYRSYESRSFWPFLSAPTQGIYVTFVRAQHSSYFWSKADLDRLAAYGHGMHTLGDAGLFTVFFVITRCW